MEGEDAQLGIGSEYNRLVILSIVQGIATY